MRAKKLKRFMVLLIIIFIQSSIFGHNPNMGAYASTTVGMAINVTDSSNQTITPYTNSGGATSNNILNPAVKLAADPKANISYGFNDVTFSKYKFVEASNLNTVPQFPEDTAMTDIPLPVPNTYDAYKDDIGKQKYLTTKHYEYAGKAGTASARNISFGTPSFNGVFEQEAVTDSTKNPVKYDLGSTNGSNFYVSQKNSDTTSYGSPVSKSSSNTITYNGKYYPKTKYASWKAMKMWGYFVPSKTGSYVLGSWSDDGAYGYIIKDGLQQVFVDDWSIQAPFDRTKNTPMQLTAGKYYPIYMEWYEGCPTQAAFVPEYQFSQTGVNNTFSSFVPIPENELYSSKTTTPGDVASAYFGDVSGISFPAQDGIYYVASKFKSDEGTTKGLYGPFVIDNTKPVLKNLAVTSNNANGNKWSVAGNTLTATFTASENLSGNPQILINGYTTSAVISKDLQNNYIATVNIEGDGSVNSNKDKLTDGPITVQVAHYADLYGNEGIAVQDSTVTYDNTAPTVAITYSANPTSVGNDVITATYSESVKSGETPQISIDQQGTTDIANNNMTAVGTDKKIWTYNYDVKADNGSAYKDGEATVALSLIHDGAGNLAAVPTGNTFTIRTKVPTVALTFSANPVSVGSEIITAIYSQAVKSGQTPQIAIDQQGTTDLIAQNMMVGRDRTTWTYDYTVHADNGSTYKDGSATANLSTVQNGAGTNALAPLANTFTIDTKAPTVALTYSSDPIKAGIETITATYSEPVKVDEIPKISIDQQGSNDTVSQIMTAVGSDKTTWTYDYMVNTNNGNTYKDGTATVSLLTMHDAAGNASLNPSGNTFNIDTIAPTLTIGAPSKTVTKTGPITYTVTYSGADKVTLNSSNVTLVKTGTADGTVTASGTGNTQTVLVSNTTGDGTLGIRIAEGTATDTAGNSAAAPPDSTTFIVRNTALLAPVITSPSDGTITNNKKPTITGTGEAGALVTVYDNGTAVGTTTVSNVGIWNFVLTNELSDGKHAMTATQRDVVEDVSGVSNTVNLTIDTTVTAPVITEPSDGSITNNNKPTISGTGEVGATITVYDNEVTIGTTIVNNIGNWSLDLANELSDGDHLLTATQSDKAGNISGKSNTVKLTVDRTTIIQHGMFINGAFNEIKTEYSIATGISGSFGVEFTTYIKNCKIKMNIDPGFTISNLKLYKIIGDGQPIYISDIEVPSKIDNGYEITMPDTDSGITHFVFVYRGIVNGNPGVLLTNTISVGNSLDSPCNIKVEDLPDLF